MNFTAAELRELALHVENELKQDIVDFDNCNACKAIPRALREYADRIDPKPDWAPCTACHKTGGAPRSPCAVCGGIGFVSTKVRS